MGYNSESKGYWIYWHKQKSISVEWNVVFNVNNITLEDENVPIPMDALAEGERDKVIQSPKPSPSSDKPNNQTEPENKPEVGEEPEKVPFPSENSPSEDSAQDAPLTPVQCHAERLRDKPTQHPGFYKDQMARTAHLEAHATCQFVEEEVDDSASMSNESNDLDDVNPPPEFNMFTVFDGLSSSIGSEPKTLDEVFNGPRANEWWAAYEYELNQLKLMGAWKVADLPEGEKVIPYQIVFKEKLDGEGKIQMYRVWIVAGGHKQISGKLYNETFTAAVKVPLIWVILGNAAAQDWETHQVDIKGAYLNALLKERVYMELPPGVLNLGKEGKVCRPLKGLYGLHQAGRGWYKEMAGVFVNKLGFKKSAVNHSVFYWRTKDEHTVIMVAIDDVAITSRWLQDVEKLKNELRQHWKISNLGELTWYLGVWVHQDQNVRTIAINQQSYIKGMLEKFWLTSAKPVSTPMDPGTKSLNEQYLLTPMQLVKMCGVPYSEAIGSVLWPVMILRPDCAFAVSTLAQFIQNPAQAYWEAVKRVMVYLGTTCTLWLTFSVKWTTKSITWGYCNMDWV